MSTGEVIALMAAANFGGVCVALAGGWAFYRFKDRKK